jgi:hypothetical protein
MVDKVDGLIALAFAAQYVRFNQMAESSLSVKTAAVNGDVALVEMHKMDEVKANGGWPPIAGSVVDIKA